jgi:uncharacterized protein YjbI with pentapeptide repeats
MSNKRVGVVPLLNSPEKEMEASRFIGLLLDGRVNEAMALLGATDGRHLLNGFDLSMREGEHQFMNFTPNGVSRTKEENRYRDLVLNNIDFRGSLFSNSIWTDCVFRDCSFKRCDFYIARFEGCTFERVRFEDCWLQNFTFGHLSPSNLGRFTDVEFIRGVFSRAYFSYPLFERCHFRCKVDNIEFEGSQFVDCSFEGILDAISFYGTYDRSEELRKALGKRHIPFNPMRNIDFSKATFQRVGIHNGIDLSTCKFPADGVLYVKDNAEVFAEVARRIEREWTGKRDDEVLECN